VSEGELAIDWLAKQLVTWHADGRQIEARITCEAAKAIPENGRLVWHAGDTYRVVIDVGPVP
jgi:hypothetical protein